MPRGTAALAAGGRAAARCVAAAGVAAFVGWLLLAATPVIKRTAAIKEGLRVAHLSGTSSFAALLTWASLLAASLATLALRRIGPPPRTPGRAGWATRVGLRAEVLLGQLPRVCSPWGAARSMRPSSPPLAPACPCTSPPAPCAQARRALAWQLPPRAFLAGWCGGLSAGEALGVLAWLALNAWWLGSLLHRSLRDGMSRTQQADK